MSIAYIIIGFILLVVGGEFLVKSSIALSFKLKLSKLIIGMTVVSFATSSPELLVSLQAALDGAPDLALGNVIGSNIANIALVLGITALISPLIIDKNFYKMNWPAMMLISLMLYFFLKNDYLLSRIEGAFLFTFLVFFIIAMIVKARKNKKNIEIDDIDDSLQSVGYLKIFFWLLIGGGALYFGSEWLVEGAKEIATKLGISEAVIGATVIAIGTSVPELAASIIAAIRGEKAISLGNLIGSNIFNIGSVLGLTAMITPIKISQVINETGKSSKDVLFNNMYWMLIIAAVLIPLIFIPKKLEIGKVKGSFLLLGYIVFVYLAFL